MGGTNRRRPEAESDKTWERPGRERAQGARSAPSGGVSYYDMQRKCMEEIAGELLRALPPGMGAETKIRDNQLQVTYPGCAEDISFRRLIDVLESNRRIVKNALDSFKDRMGFDYMSSQGMEPEPRLTVTVYARSRADPRGSLADSSKP